MQRKRTPYLFIAFLAAVFFIFGLYNRLTVRHYTVEAGQIQNPVRIVLITDLHSCRYGDGQQELIEAVRAQSPDLILLAGDIFDDRLPDRNTVDLLRALPKISPCYYVTGNHECWSGSAAFARKMSSLEQCGVTRLSGETVTVSVRDELINICGVDDPDLYLVADTDGEQSTADFAAQVAAVRELSRENDGYTILLSHRPESFELYAHHGFDLALCGHAHGGQWRVPGILNGLYAPNQGLFPKYAGGKYQSGTTAMIVSRGLARESTPIPRFYNRPELVVVDLL